MAAWTDQQILTMLDMMDGNGRSSGEVARAFGTSRSAICGVVARVRNDLAASEAAGFAPGQGPAVRPENRDGALGRRWWA